VKRAAMGFQRLARECLDRCSRLWRMWFNHEPGHDDDYLIAYLSDLRDMIEIADWRYFRRLTRELVECGPDNGFAARAIFFPLLELADVLDRAHCFLDTIPHQDGGAALARACRDDLDAFGILADWCEEHDQAHAAAEARHLGGLLRCARKQGR
jgi:hypothetical protein